MFVCFWPHHCAVACGILVSPPGIEPGPSAVRAQSPNHWTAREFPMDGFILDFSREELDKWGDFTVGIVFVNREHLKSAEHQTFISMSS